MNTKFQSELDAILVSPGFIANPYPVLRQMREEAPVYWSEAIGAWILTRYDDILVSFKNTGQYSNENRLGQAISYLPPEKQDNYRPFAEHYATKSLLHSDPPDHTRLRALVTKEFNAAVVEQIRPRIEQVVNGLLDQVAPGGTMDVVADLAAPLPIGVISEILGVDPADRHLLRDWTDALLSFQGVAKPSEADIRWAQDALVQMRPYIRRMIEERRRTPRQDLMSKFAAAEMSGDRLTEAELIGTCVTLMVAGHETTLSVISNTLWLLASHPDQADLVRNDPDLIPPAIEESLRFESPVSRQARRMKQDAGLGGHTLRQGQMLFQMLNSANRDPAYFTDPDTFDVRREKNRHIAFGFGTHFCVGAPLARAEAAIAIGAVLKRFPNLRLANPAPDWDITKRNSRVLKSLKLIL